MAQETGSLDPLDRQIVRCVQLSPRVPFRSVADVLGVSEQTVARRFRRLERAGIVRVTSLLRPSAVGQHNWMVRVQVRPSGAEALARALAQRDDVSWVTLATGGSEIICVLRARTSEARDDLLMQRLPRTTPVMGLSAAMVLHRFVGASGKPETDWTGLGDSLTAEQQAAMLATATLVPQQDVRFPLEPADRVLLDELAADGRASYARLAKAAGISETRAARRLVALIEGGAAYLDVDLSVQAFGLHSSATLWLTVTPSALHDAGLALEAESEVAFAGAITGPSNLVASVVCRDVDHLYAHHQHRRRDRGRAVDGDPAGATARQAGGRADRRRPPRDRVRRPRSRRPPLIDSRFWSSRRPETRVDHGLRPRGYCTPSRSMTKISVLPPSRCPPGGP